MNVPCPACSTVAETAEGQDLKAATCAKCGGPLFTGQPIHLTGESFNVHALADVPIVIDFWAVWCGPCQSFAPVFERVAAEMEPLVRFAKVNTDVEQGLSNYFRIQTIPTLSMIRGQREVARISGAMPASDFRRWIYEALSKA